jgi:hypothetical protein
MVGANVERTTKRKWLRAKQMRVKGYGVFFDWKGCGFWLLFEKK